MHKIEHATERLGLEKVTVSECSVFESNVQGSKRFELLVNLAKVLGFIAWKQSSLL